MIQQHLSPQLETFSLGTSAKFGRQTGAQVSSVADRKLFDIITFSAKEEGSRAPNLSFTYLIRYIPDWIPFMLDLESYSFNWWAAY